MMSDLDNTQCNILIVDDVSKNIQLLGSILRQEGYSLSFATSGKQALDMVVSDTFDLILLDVMMPEMDGFEVCKRLKQQPDIRDIPVIFLTAKAEAESVVNGFELGAVDYVTKPFNVKELLARVKAHLTIIQQRRQLEQLNASKDTFLSMIAHDLRSPFSALQHLIHLTAEQITASGHTTLEQTMKLIETSTDNLHALLENLLTWSRIQRGVMEYHPHTMDVHVIVTRNVELLASNAEQKQMSLKNMVAEQLLVSADMDMIDAVVRNLISNALKFTEAGGSIEVRATHDERHVTVSVSDTGIGIAEEHLSKLFRIDAKYKRLGTAREKGTGLGLILCKEFVEQHGGTIRVESEVGKGTTFSFTLPKVLGK
jgi:signal transduction histidine kinase